MTLTPRKFCFVATARTGTNFIRAFVRSMPGVVFQGELFNRERHLPTLKPLTDFPLTLEDRDKDPLGFLKTVETMCRAIKPVFAFKLMIPHNFAVLEHVVTSPEYGVIVVDRKNRLAQFSSRLIARQSGVWHLHVGQAVAPPTKVHFDRIAFGRFLSEMEQDYALVVPRLDSQPERRFLVEYTQIRSLETLKRLLAFMGLKAPGSIASQLEANPCLQQNTSQIVDRFTNADEVRAAMRDIGHEDWLVETTP